MGNSNATIREIKELPLKKQKELDAQSILAIAYFYNGQDDKAGEIWP